jgi:hypothetical protein
MARVIFESINQANAHLIVDHGIWQGRTYLANALIVLDPLPRPRRDTAFEEYANEIALISAETDAELHDEFKRAFFAGWSARVKKGGR